MYRPEREDGTATCLASTPKLVCQSSQTPVAGRAAPQIPAGQFRSDFPAFGPFWFYL